MILNVFLPEYVTGVANRIKSAGGKAYLVGGAVLDLLNNRWPKDIDIEVFGLTYAQLTGLFPAGNTVGASFGVLKILVSVDLVGNIEFDLSIPRTDNRIGVGHKDFEVSLDPNMTIELAARRRDFTINAMSVDLATGLLVDPFNGRSDFRAGILRVIDPELFVQDPLRVLRAMQLSARKCPTVDPASMYLMQQMVGSFHTLPEERIFAEWVKLLLRAAKPSIGLRFLRDSGWLMHFRALQDTIGVGQHPVWHAEGDVWTHSLLAVDAAASIRDRIPKHQQLAFMFGALLHDVGKATTTITPEMCSDPAMLWTAYGHDKAGVEPSRGFLRTMTRDKKLITLVTAIVELHMQPYNLYQGDAKRNAYARLSRKMQAAGGDLQLLTNVCLCDSCASGLTWATNKLVNGKPNWTEPVAERMTQYVDMFDAEPELVAPKVMGRDLIALGVSPGPLIGRLLRDAMALQDGDDTLTKEAILAAVMSCK